MSDNALEYYSMRADQERKMANNAVNFVVQKAHSQMAERYMQLATQVAPIPQERERYRA